MDLKNRPTEQLEQASTDDLYAELYRVQEARLSHKSLYHRYADRDATLQRIVKFRDLKRKF